MTRISEDAEALGDHDAALIFRSASNSFDIVLPADLSAGEGEMTVGILALVFAFVAFNSEGGLASAANAGLQLMNGGRKKGELNG